MNEQELSDLKQQELTPENTKNGFMVQKVLIKTVMHRHHQISK